VTDLSTATTEVNLCGLPQNSLTFSKCKLNVPTLDLPRKQGVTNIILTLMSKQQLSNQTTLPVTDID